MEEGRRGTEERASPPRTCLPAGPPHPLPFSHSVPSPHHRNTLATQPPAAHPPHPPAPAQTQVSHPPTSKAPLRPGPHPFKSLLQKTNPWGDPFWRWISGPGGSLGHTWQATQADCPSQGPPQPPPQAGERRSQGSGRERWEGGPRLLGTWPQLDLMQMHSLLKPRAQAEAEATPLTPSCRSWFRN